MVKDVDLNERDEILKYARLVERSEVICYKHVVTNYLIAYRGRAFIVNEINGKIMYFVEVLPDEHRGD